MNRPEYSELPWRVDRTWGSEMILDANGGVMFNDNSNDTPEGTAEHIVHCVNTHDTLLELISEMDEALGWFTSFYNDVQNTTPEYFELCGDIGALMYLRSEAQAIQARARAILATHEARP